MILIFRRLLLLLILFCFAGIPLHAKPPVRPVQQDTLKFIPEKSDSVMNDSAYVMQRVTFLDTITNDTLFQQLLSGFHFKIDTTHLENPLDYLKPSRAMIREKTSFAKDWVFYLICFILLILALNRMINNGNQLRQMKSVFNLKLSEQLINDQKSDIHFANIQFFVVHVLILSFSIFVLIDFLNIKLLDNDFLMYLILMAGVCTIYMLKYFFYFLAGYLSGMENMSLSVINSTININYLYSLVIFPVFALLYYDTKLNIDQPLLVFSAVFTFVYVIVRMIRSVLLNYNFFPFSIFYLFIYLCTFEIIPLLVLTKLIINQINN